MEKDLLRKIQLAQLDIIKIIDKICAEENIVYYLCAGTMLGAVRHSGFIPWDDDLDIMLPREHYNRLMDALKKRLPSQFWLQTYETDEGYWQPYAKVRKINTVYKEKGMEHIPDEKCGIWIDIFPLDYANKNNICLKIRRLAVKIISYSLRRREFCLKITSFSRRYIPLLFVLELIPKQKAKRLQEKIMEQNPNKRNLNLLYMINLASTYKIDKETFPCKWFKESKKIKFEDTKLPIPNGYKEYLTQLYGNYMELPPVEKRTGHNISECSKIVV